MPFRVYTVSVSAVNEIGQGDAVHDVITTRETVPVGAPSNPAFSSLDTTSVVFSWSDVPCAQRGGVFLRYEVEVYKQQN